MKVQNSFIRVHYFEALDLIVNCICNRFDQPGYKVYSSLESLLIKSCKGEDFEENIEEVCTFYRDDFNKDLLHAQLQTFQVHFQQVYGDVNVSVFELRKYFESLTTSQVCLMSEVTKLMHLVLVMPATNATSERSFSALRRVKTYLRSTMLQLNYLMLLHVHNDQTSELDIKSALNEFVGDSVHRSNIFAKY